jgi:hypothetical protein
MSDCEIVIRYNPRRVAPTTLIWMELDLKRYAEKFFPPLPIKFEKMEIKK